MRRISILTVILVSVLSYSCQQNGKEKMPYKLLKEKEFIGQLTDKGIKLFTLSNENGLSAQITNLGGRVVSLWVPDKAGNFADVSLGFATAQDYYDAGERYYGCSIGRYGNRIAKGKFSIGEETFTLNCNNGANTLHGGPTGFGERIWKGKQLSPSKLEISYKSADGEEGYPGNLNVRVLFHLTNDNEFKIEYFATCDKTCPVNLTNHTFFNLAGEASGTINNHLLMINADHFTPIDSTLIPTGDIADVSGTPFDFRKASAIGSRLDIVNQQLKFGAGYDHNWVLNQNGNGLFHAATLTEPISGRTMEVITNEPGLQFYGGNFMSGSDIGKFGKAFNYREALCLETQHFPDSPNHSNFPSTLLNPGEEYYSICVYKFTQKQ